MNGKSHLYPQLYTACLGTLNASLFTEFCTETCCYTHSSTLQISTLIDICLWNGIVSHLQSPWAHFRRGFCGLCLLHKSAELAHSFWPVLVSISVFMALSTLFHSINYPENPPPSHFLLQVLFLLYGLFQLHISLWKSPSALIQSVMVDWDKSTDLPNFTDIY